jgi:hypothetical protein
MAFIDTSTLMAFILKIEFSDCTIDLPAWRNDDGTIFLSTQDLHNHLRVDFRISQASEWLALDEIPANMVAETRHFENLH